MEQILADVLHGSSQIIPYIAGALTVLLTGHINYLYSKKSEIRKEKIRVYGRLMALRIRLRQVIVSRYEAYICSDYHEALWKTRGASRESIDLEESRRWMTKAEEYVVDITKTLEDLFELYGSISILFDRDTEILKLLDKLYHYPTIIPPIYPATIPENELSDWKKEAIRQVQELAEKAYGEPLDLLVKALWQKK